MKTKLRAKTTTNNHRTNYKQNNKNIQTQKLNNQESTKPKDKKEISNTQET